MNLLRIDPVDAVGHIAHIPTARYAYVAIVPSMFLLALGWGAWWPARRRRLALVILVSGVLAINLWLLITAQIPWYWSS
jgi:hypothetical protein